jgi:hypothetical protein
MYHNQPSLKTSSYGPIGHDLLKHNQGKLANRQEKIADLATDDSFNFKLSNQVNDLG